MALGAKKLVQLQIKVINIFATFTLLTLFILTLPILITAPNTYNNQYPVYVKNIIACSFAVSLVPTIIFIHSNQEIVISN